MLGILLLVIQALVALPASLKKGEGIDVKLFHPTTGSVHMRLNGCRVMWKVPIQEPVLQTWVLTDMTAQGGSEKIAKQGDRVVETRQ